MVLTNNNGTTMILYVGKVATEVGPAGQDPGSLELSVAKTALW